MLAVTPTNFRAQMKYLKDNFPVIRFEEDLANVDRPSVVVTFDDGYPDNLLEALPILEEVGVPATFFVTTDPIETGKELWWDQLEFLILGHRSFPSSFELKDRQYNKKWPTSTDVERRSLHQEIVPLMKKIDFRRREDWMCQLRNWVGMPEHTRPSHRPITVDELRTLAKSPMVTIGAHGVTHAAFSALTPIEQKEEFTISKSKLEKWLEQDISVFAYPYGDRIYYNRDSIRLCKEVGFKQAAAANFFGQRHRWTDPYQIPRHMVLNWPVDTFVTKISTFWIR